MASVTLLLAAEPDQVILPTVYDFLARYGLRPVDAQEYSISAGRFARIEWALSEAEQQMNPELDSFDKDFGPIADAFKFQYKVGFCSSPFRVGLFCPSVNDSLEKVLHKYSPVNGYDMQVAFVIGDHIDLQTSANRYGVPYFDVKSDDALVREAQFSQLISRYKPDLFAIMPPVQNLSAGLLEKLPCSVLAVSEAVVPSNTPGLKLDAESAGAGVLLASAYILEADVNQRQLVVQQAKPILQKRSEISEFLRSGSEQQELEIEVLVRALAKFTQHKVIAYKEYLYVFD